MEIERNPVEQHKNKYFNNEKVMLEPYWPDYNNPLLSGPQRNIVEIPVTVGFNHANYPLMLKVYNVVSSPIFNFLRLVGILWHTRILRTLYLSPEATSGKDMRPLIDSALKNGHPVIHMYFHSSSSIDDSTGLMKGNNTYQTICDNIEQALDYLSQKANVKFCTISEAACILKQRDS